MSGSDIGDNESPEESTLRIYAEGAAPTPAPKAAIRNAADSTPCLVQIAPMNATVGSRFPLSETRSLIGRDARCSVLAPDTSVSRMHAQVERRGVGFYAVADL